MLLGWNTFKFLAGEGQTDFAGNMMAMHCQPAVKTTQAKSQASTFPVKAYQWTNNQAFGFVFLPKAKPSTGS